MTPSHPLVQEGSDRFTGRLLTQLAAAFASCAVPLGARWTSVPSLG